MASLFDLIGPGVTEWRDKNKNALLGLGTSLLSSGMDFSGVQRGAAMDQEMQERRKAEERKAAEQQALKGWLSQAKPELAPLLDAGIDGNTLVSQALQPPAGPDYSNLREINGQLVDMSTGQVVGDYRSLDPSNQPTPPSGYRWTADGSGLEAIPGGPSDPALKGDKADLAAGRRDVATQTITNAAAEARRLAKNEFNVGLVGAGAGFNPQTDAAELRRQVDVLKSTASIENLTAMRQASPTGGALGAVSDRENAMLAAASGAIDPNAGAEAFNRALDNYELTLLQIVHGPEAGLKIYKDTRSGGYAAGNAASGQGGGAAPAGIDPAVWAAMTPEEQSLWN